ncbi:putative serine protease PepD [Conyzicola nivalis]|uniref:Serine protease PepD n=1 Tax=Conyzicola nivalis TaxID=1477021 RepID=A0ABV2QHX3_9MICO
MTDTPEIPETPSNATPAAPPTPPTPPVPRALSEAPAQSTQPLPDYAASAPTPPSAAGSANAPAAESANANAGASFRRTKPVLLVAALAVGALVGGVAGGGIVLALNGDSSNSSVSANTTPANITVNNPDNATTVTAVAAKATPSVVTISAKSSDSGGTGSGVIISDDGYVLTNTHVVTLDGATGDAAISVQTNDGRLFTAKLIGTDPISDLAVIKIDDATDLQPASFADSSKLNVGDTAIAIGAPLGLSGTVTDGIVSAINRSITIASSAAPDNSEIAPDTTTPGQQSPFEFLLPEREEEQSAPSQSSSTISLAVIQTDAAINPGNSGGALLNADGEVIGINVAIASAGGSSAASQAGSIGVGFAIPANLAERVSKEIIENGAASHGLLGATIGNVTDEATPASGASVGATVREISAGGAAEAAGLKTGDIITGIDGLPVTNATDLTAQVRALAGGAKTTITYVRGGEATTVDVTLGTLK